MCMTIWRKTASPALLMLICLAFLFATSEAVTLADEQQIESNRLAYDALRRAVLESYSYRDRLELDWEALFDAHRDSLLSASSNRAFAIQAAKLLSNAKDPHM